MRQHIKKGDYYTRCCHLDVERCVEGFYNDTSEFGTFGIWDNKLSMVVGLSNMWWSSRHINGVKPVLRNMLECWMLLFRKF